MKHVKEEFRGISIELNTSIGRQRIELVTATPEQIEMLHSYGLETDHFFDEIPQKETVIHYQGIEKPKTKTKKK